MKFKRIPEQFPIEDKDSFLYAFVSAIILLAGLVFLQSKLRFPEILIVPFGLLGIYFLRRGRKLLSDWTREKDYIGEINFLQDKIVFNKESSKIDISAVVLIHFRYNYIKGWNFAPKGITHNGLAELNLTKRDNKKITLKFVIETEEQFDFLKILFRNWYRKGIEIKEEFTNQKVKTICLEVIGTMSFQEMKELRKQLKI